MTACLTSPYALIGETQLSQPAHQLPRYFEPTLPLPPVQPAPVIKPKPVVAPAVAAVAVPDVKAVATSG